MIRRATIILMLAGIAFYIAWDIFAILKGGSSATISEISLRAMWLHPGLAMIVGGLLGHLTWPKRQVLSDLDTAMTALPTAGAIAVLDVTHVLPAMMPLWPFLAGVVVGHFVFPQKQKADEV